jgi:hypothetical protein
MTRVGAKGSVRKLIDSTATARVEFVLVIRVGALATCTRWGANRINNGIIGRNGNKRRLTLVQDEKGCCMETGSEFELTGTLRMGR